MEAIRWSWWETHCGECRTNYRQLKRGHGLQRAVLLWEILIGITMALAIRWGRCSDSGETGEEAWCQGVKGHVERTGSRDRYNQSLLPGLSVLEWSCCVCVGLRWMVHYFFRCSFIFLYVCAICWSSSATLSLTHRFPFKQQNGESCLSWTVMSTHRLLTRKSAVATRGFGLEEDDR